jgi:hypothetical protein
MYATAGIESSSFLIQAVNTFGYRQLNIDDNFTVTITVRTRVPECVFDE